MGCGLCYKAGRERVRKGQEKTEEFKGEGKGLFCSLICWRAHNVAKILIPKDNPFFLSVFKSVS